MRSSQYSSHGGKSVHVLSQQQGKSGAESSTTVSESCTLSCKSIIIARFWHKLTSVALSALSATLANILFR